MKTDLAVKRLSALSHNGRLDLFRLLVKAGPDGKAAGELATELNVASNTLSAQLLVLSNAGLISARRDGRSIIYSAKFDGMRDLLVFLTADCCDGRSEVCAPLIEAASNALCCPPVPKANRR